ncbi:5-(carboxyamino)imidazole ribonucleotide synthase [Albimonas pacifica]|uniref:N5-carboxyaminoimidazole ribonucleotide synthase n=1 Tax=Albimonas pacifica TaxID=1114924 RepID=A0A1I3F491_9RHOB|nr:5-(carboxyamino)imidazole ribonucleotide synthase [Albimonas pacifica]SFI06038.1 5-(carboxyamino)imidazole ribonucleotide synthase [Albimonas pacifica]
MTTEPTAEPIAPGGTLGILGGGQLARMLSMAAARLGIRCVILAPEAEPCAGDVAHRVIRADYADPEAHRELAAACAAVTYEFENVPVDAARALQALVPVRPGPKALEIAQDRVPEKDFLNGIGLSTAPYRAVDSEAELAAAFADLGGPAILKTRRLGYDGKGQARLNGPADVPAAWAAVAGAPSVLEGFVPFRREVSVIAARSLTGEVVAFDPAENVHAEGILRTSIVPSGLTAMRRTDAVLAAGKILQALDYVGVIGVEFFETAQGLVVNEIAPRVHNTGHWTLDACLVDQFEQHVRAVCGWPLGDGARHSDAVMSNLIGDDASDWRALAADPGGRLHLYGKGEARPGRKMGHVTRLTPRS